MKVVVDASNVAHHVKNENGQPKMSNILAAVKALEESEDEFVIIADASLRHDIDDRERFERLLESENVEEVPAGNDADHFILDIATREKAKILSKLALSLLVLGVFANYHNATLALDDLTLFAHGFNGRSYLHTV